VIAKIDFSARISALVFDAYGTLFDVQSVVTIANHIFPGHGRSLSQLWRAKQLEYTWLQTIMRSTTQPRQDFAALTAYALEHAAQTLGLALPPPARHRLLDAYLDLTPFSDAEPALSALAPLPRIILSNGSIGMLAPLVAASGLGAHIDAVLSVDDADAYKPSPSAYRLAVDHLDLPPEKIAFISSNGWDAIGAKACGFTVFWINRTEAPLDRHGPAPDATLASLSELPPLLGR